MGENGAIAGSDERDELLVELYHEFRSCAARMLRCEAPNLTLQPTELVNEAALRIIRIQRMEWQDRQHFFATGAKILRQAMIDAIRQRRRLKRRAPTVLVAEDDDQPVLDVEALDGALTRLEAVSPELAQVVELRFFVGLGIEEIASFSGVSARTIKRRWQTARLWLASEMAGE